MAARRHCDGFFRWFLKDGILESGLETAITRMYNILI